MHAHRQSCQNKNNSTCTTLILCRHHSAHCWHWHWHRWLDPHQLLGKSYCFCFCSLFAHIIVWAAPLLRASCCPLVSWTRRPSCERLQQSNALLPFGAPLTPSAIIFPPLHLSFIRAQAPSGAWAHDRLLPFQGQSTQVHGGRQQRRLLPLAEMHPASFGEQFWHVHWCSQERFGLVPCLSFCGPRSIRVLAIPWLVLRESGSMGSLPASSRSW